MTGDTRQHAHELIDRLPEAQISGLVRFLETIVEPGSRRFVDAPIDDEPESEEERRAVAAPKEWFRNHQGIPFEEVVADLGFTMEQIREHKEPV